MTSLTHTVGLVLLLAILAQPLSAQRFRGSLVGGATLSQIDGDLLSGFHKFGLQGGIRVNTIFTERWELSTELLFSQQGARRSINDDPSSIYDRIQLNFVEVPVLINFNDWKFQVGAGLSYARLINYEVEDIFGTVITDLETFNEDVFSLVISVTFNFTDQVAMNFRWSRYLNDLQGDPDENQFIGRVIGLRGIYYFF